jgi:hypothetical protein
MEKTSLRRADIVFSVVLMMISIIVMIESINILINPFGRSFEKVSAESIKNNILKWYESPALIPFLLAVVLLLLSVSLLHIALKDGARLDFVTKVKLFNFIKNREFIVSCSVISCLCVYAYILIPFCRRKIDFFPRFQGFPFMVATYIYLALMMIIFNKKSLKKIIVSLILSAVASFIIIYGFGMLALIPLP